MTTFIGILCLPLLLLALGLRAIPIENRRLAELPSLRGFELLAQSNPSAIFDPIFKDHLPHKTALTTWYLETRFRLFNESPSDRVSLGRNDWLFFRPSLYSFSLGQGSDAEALIKRVLRLKQAAHALGKRFVLVLSPNKASIYPEYLTSDIRRHHDSVLLPTRKEFQHFAATEPAMIDLWRILQNEKVVFSQRTIQTAKAWQTRHLQFLFRPSDRHWHREAGEIQGHAILDSLGLPNVTRTYETKSTYFVRNGELPRRFFLFEIPEVYLRFPRLQEGVSRSSIQIAGKQPLIQFKNRFSNREFTILAMHDSFINSSLQTLAENTSAVTALHWTSWNEAPMLFHTYINEADAIVVQMVEDHRAWRLRSMDRLAEHMESMAASKDTLVRDVRH